ncbi:hypothetical protein AB0C34_01250 [Nocardia sp. NPDC049220]|uniref:hypothetical protein n=1 Tax=Nocardia sp. NPDC049220 TaxID=3155273 RepID=UPI0033ECE0ED
MSFEFDRPTAQRRGAVARLRGGSAGAISGAVSVAAHGWASGGMPPNTTALALLAAGSAVICSMVAGLTALRDSSIGLVAALVIGQLLGHLTMGFSSGHTQHGDTQLTPVMLTAHLIAAVVAAVVIQGAQTAYRIGTAALARVTAIRRIAPVVMSPTPVRIGHRDRVILRVFAAESLRTRAPPSPARI